jgi:hypothetical protein
MSPTRRAPSGVLHSTSLTVVFEAAATQIRPGDQVLLTSAVDHPQELLGMISMQLEERFPGVKFAIMSGISGIVIDRQDETDEPARR